MDEHLRNLRKYLFAAIREAEKLEASAPSFNLALVELKVSLKRALEFAEEYTLEQTEQGENNEPSTAT